MLRGMALSPVPSPGLPAAGKAAQGATLQPQGLLSSICSALQGETHMHAPQRLLPLGGTLLVHPVFPLLQTLVSTSDLRPFPPAALARPQPPGFDAAAPCGPGLLVLGTHTGQSQSLCQAVVPCTLPSRSAGGWVPCGLCLGPVPSLEGSKVNRSWPLESTAFPPQMPRQGPRSAQHESGTVTGPGGHRSCGCCTWSQGQAALSGSCPPRRLGAEPCGKHVGCQGGPLHSQLPQRSLTAPPDF